MPGLTIEEARDFILSKFKTAWDLNTPAINNGIIPVIEYQNIELDKSPLANGNKPWARISVRHSSFEQGSLGNIGNRIFTRRGIVTTQIFVPVGKQGLVLADKLGKVALDAYEGEETSNSQVWFKNVTYREIGIDNSWFQTNVTAEFEYDFVK